jgi:hypothetical protein
MDVKMVGLMVVVKVLLRAPPMADKMAVETAVQMV